jgi:hypothetical protein
VPRPVRARRCRSRSRGYIVMLFERMSAADPARRRCSPADHLRLWQGLGRPLGRRYPRRRDPQRTARPGSTRSATC